MPKIPVSAMALLALLSGIPHAHASSPSYWDLDMTHSSVGFVVRHMTVTNVRGEFNEASGTLVFDPRDPTRSRIETTIKAASIDTKLEKRDEHLRNEDFLYVARYPSITFRSTRIVRTGGHYLVTGKLTIRDVTREVTLKTTAPSPVITDPWGGRRIGFSASVRIDRKAFNVRWNVALDNGGLVVADEVDIILELQFVERKPSATSAD